nr:hypothetical protein [Tanacetum cinerariifolium]
MSSDSHATISYTSILSYEVIVNGYYGMPMDPLDPYVQLVMGAPPSPDYIPGPKAPPSPDYIPGPENPEYLPPADDVLPAEKQPLPAAISPTAESPGYIADSDPEMDPEEEDGDDEESEEDSIDYPTSRGDDDANDDGDELSDDDAGDDDEEDSILAFEDSDETEPFEEGETAATPPPFLMPLPIFTPLPTSSFPLPLSIPSNSGSESIPEADIPLRKRARFTNPTSRYEIGESSVAAAARQIRPTLTIADKRRADDKLIGRLRRERRYFRTLATTYAQEVAYSRDYCTQVMDYCQSREKMAPKRARTTRANPDPTRTTTATEPMTQEAINNLIAQRPRIVRPTRECTYKDYLNCGPLKFNGTEGIIGLTRWFEQTESVSNISNCIAENQVKFASYTLIGSALTWWNSHMRAVGQEVKGTDITSYTLRFQELSLLCGRIFLEEPDEIERYVGGLPEMIQGNVMSYEPKSMQKAIESANEQMDQKLIGIADRQAENNKKFDNTSRNQQNQQPFKRNKNVIQAYAVGSGEKPYRGIKPLYPKCNFYHDGPCRPKCTNCKKTGHLTRDCRSRAANNNNNNNNNNNQRATSAYQGVPTCFECGAQGHFKNNYPRLGNRNQGNQNQAGNGNVVARAYGLGTAGGNPNANVVTGTFLLNNHCASILFDIGADKSFVSTADAVFLQLLQNTIYYLNIINNQARS